MMEQEQQNAVYTLFSGSKGNAVYIRIGGEALLVDCGRSAKALREALTRIDGHADQLRGIFVTHEHIDHIRGIPVFTRQCPLPIHVTEPSAPYIDCGDCAVVHPPLFTCTVGNLEISSFLTPHDSVMSVGYVIRGEGMSVGVATDIGQMTDEIAAVLAGCDTVVLESNHDIDRLMRGPYPYPLKQRILSPRGHLSNEECAACAVRLADSGVRNIVLAHLSAENNQPELAYRATASRLEAGGYRHTRLLIADEAFPTRVL